jgi:hypothetical protein
MKNRDLTLVLIAFGALLLMPTNFRNNTRGMRNNNPGNLKELPGDSTQWVGERATDDDPLFEEFTSMEAGIRALGRVLNTYAANGFVTPRAIANRYAPQSDDNPTSEYALFIAEYAGVDDIDDAVLPEKKIETMRAIIHFENGFNPFSDAYIASVLDKPDSWFV